MSTDRPALGNVAKAMGLSLEDFEALAAGKFIVPNKRPLPPNVPDFLKAPASNAEREPETWAIFEVKNTQWDWSVRFLRTQDRASPDPCEISVKIFPAPKGPVTIASYDKPDYEG